MSELALFKMKQVLAGPMWETQNPSLRPADLVALQEKNGTKAATMDRTATFSSS